MSSWARLLRPSAFLLATLLFAAIVAWTILGPSVINPRNIKWLKGDPAQHYLGWAFFRMENSWKLPLGYTSKLNFPDGTQIAYTDSMPIIAAAMKVFSRRLPSTFQYLGLVGFANYLLQAFFGYKIGFALLKDRLLAALAGAFFTLAPPFILRTGFHFSLSSQWLILAGLWLYLRFDQERDKERTTVIWFCVLFLFAGGITPYIAVLCAFVCLATALLAFARTRRNWPIRIALWLAPAAVLLLSWILFGFFDLDLGADEYAAPGYRHHSLNHFGSCRSAAVLFAALQRSGRLSRPERGIRLSWSGNYFPDRCLGHFRAVVALPFEACFSLAALAGRRFVLCVRGFGEGHLWPKRPA